MGQKSGQNWKRKSLILIAFLHGKDICLCAYNGQRRGSVYCQRALHQLFSRISQIKVICEIKFQFTQTRNLCLLQIGNQDWRGK